jgi:hypothetical protein
VVVGIESRRAKVARTQLLGARTQLLGACNFCRPDPQRCPPPLVALSYLCTGWRDVIPRKAWSFSEPSRALFHILSLGGVSTDDETSPPLHFLSSRGGVSKDDKKSPPLHSVGVTVSRESWSSGISNGAPCQHTSADWKSSPPARQQQPAPPTKVLQSSAFEGCNAWKVLPMPSIAG